MTRCMECGKANLISVTLPVYSTDLEHDGRTYHVDVPNLPVLQCPACEEVLMTGESASRTARALRAAAGLLSGEEIREGRRRLGLTQEKMASWLSVASATLSRWETGAQMQQRVMDTYLRAFFALSDLRSFLETADLRGMDAAEAAVKPPTPTDSSRASTVQVI